MFLPLIIHDYFVWHYGRAWWQLWGVWRNFMWFFIHFFSIPQLLRSLFAPFKRITEGRGNPLDFEDFAGYVIINLLSRVFGAVIRLSVILVGLVVLALTIAVGFFIYALWAVLPFIIIGLIGAGLSLLFISL